ncbi:hypothetical protein SPRG_08269 [Saprolegnia parasitica CBS 223.65]|uniref:Metalloendopeptidase n=1 Tax=Saprolegnia parasitica (strain CBS 223.65) TaxID=695850 RepID=A0A067CIT0_SAPPC|nr:hypothetical protein SPRG_08269 [Saprolegnia parasitica CBS 223.65]KDO26466.1 hypothetical protein SPRG_08269 [Saprolegnia parasitica CBS 223.65]|eukprot:XP_012202901.1 hypothetical protein SPRG_08269 [Saprolegnia parasitica CBS 223.65]
MKYLGALATMASLAAAGVSCELPLDAVHNPDGRHHLGDGQLKYVFGLPQDDGAIYQVCADGVITCYEEDGTADSDVDAIVDCRKAEAKRRLGLATDRKRRLWPLATLCYKLDAPFDDVERRTIQRAMHEIVESTGVTMLDVANCKHHDAICGGCAHYVSIAQERNKRGTYAELGYRHKAGQKLNLLPSAFEHGMGSVMHEMLHAFGVIHEHAHPASEAIVLRGQFLGASRSNYMPIKEAFVTQYDIHSIMHYGVGLCLPTDKSIKFCAIDQNEDDGCVVPEKHHCDPATSKVLGQRDGLSSGDIRNLQILYGLETTVTRHEVAVQQTVHKRIHAHGRHADY